MKWERKTGQTRRNKKYQNKLTALIRGLNSIGKDLNDKMKTSSSRQPHLKTQKELMKQNYAICTKDIPIVKSKIDLINKESSIESNSSHSNQFNSLEYKSNKSSDLYRNWLTSEDLKTKHKYWTSLVKSNKNLSKRADWSTSPIHNSKLKSPGSSKIRIEQQFKYPFPVSTSSKSIMKFNSPLSQFMNKHKLVKSKHMLNHLSAEFLPKPNTNEKSKLANTIEHEGNLNFVYDC